jgi:hypothetical protein
MFRFYRRHRRIRQAARSSFFGNQRPRTIGVKDAFRNWNRLRRRGGPWRLGSPIAIRAAFRK